MNGPLVLLAIIGISCLAPRAALCFEVTDPVERDQFARNVRVDSRGDIFVLSEGSNPSGNENPIVRLRKLDAFDGHELWSQMWGKDWAATITDPWCWRGFGPSFPDVHPIVVDDDNSLLLAGGAQLIRALLLLARAGIVAGLPYSGELLGSFEAYSRVIGGILEAVEIPGFLANVREVYAESDVETEELQAFLAAGWETYRDRPVEFSSLYALCAAKGLLLLARGPGNDSSQRTKFGIYMHRLDKRIAGTFRIEVVRSDGKRPTVYALRRTLEAAQSEETPSAEPKIARARR